MLFVEEDSPERDTAASKNVCPNLSKFKRILRFLLEQILTAYQFLDLAARRAWDLSEIYKVVSVEYMSFDLLLVR